MGGSAGAGAASPALTCARGGARPAGGAPGLERVAQVDPDLFPSRPLIPAFYPHYPGGFIPLILRFYPPYTEVLSPYFYPSYPAVPAPCGELDQPVHSAAPIPFNAPRSRVSSLRVFPLCFLWCRCLLSLILNRLSQNVVGLREEFGASTCVRGFYVSLHNSGDSCFFLIPLFLGMLWCDHW